MPTEDLYAFAHATRGVQPRAAARRIFGTAANGRTAAVRELRAYAWNTITARACRLRGDVETALKYEAIAQRIYDDLPDFARW